MLEQVEFSKDLMAKEEYKPVHDKLIEKLVLLQQEARSKEVGLVVLFEGWNGAGKGKRISDLVYELDARSTKVHVTKDLDPKETKAFPGSDWGVTGMNPFMKQFWDALGERSEITFFDRGWYAVGAQQALFGLTEAKPKKMKKVAKKLKKLAAAAASAEEARERLHDDAVGAYAETARDFEKMLHDDGYAVVKIFVHVSKKVQKERLERLYNDPEQSWRVSKQKLENAKYYDEAYKIYDRFLELSNYDFAPWTIVNGEDRRESNIQVASALISALEGALAAKEAKGAAGAKDVGAPESSRFEIIEDYPRIDHSVKKPRLENDAEYKDLLKEEQKRFSALQVELYRKRIPLMIMYEGWDAAGKGGNIKRVAQALDARAYEIITSPAPSKIELAHPHLWRYWTRQPKAGHVGIYDRSWYGRVLVERVEGYTAPEDWARGYDELNAFEQELIQWGVILLKFWVDITPDEQLKRFEARQNDPTKTWKITDDDWRNREKYPQYKEAIDDMFRLTSTTFAPWIVLESDDKHYARIQALRAINEAIEARLGK